MTVHLIFPHETYRVNEYQEIARANWPHSHTWLLTGAIEYRTVFGQTRAVKRYTFEDIKAKRVPWFYKNGKQRCFPIDLDHGCVRVMMSPRLLDVMVTN